MSTLNVINRDGQQQELQIDAGENLMEVLRDQNVGIDGTCGGAACCGSCHVYLTDDWIEKLPADPIEQATIEGLVHGAENSRLSCQIDTRKGLDNMTLTVAPSEI